MPDAKYVDELGFKYIFIGIIFIKYYITHTKTLKVKVVKEILRKSKLNNYFKTDVMLLYNRSMKICKYIVYLNVRFFSLS